MPVAAKESGADTGEPSAQEERVVFLTLRDSSCAECDTPLPRGSFLIMERDQPHCLSCTDLDHLVFLPRGDTALTRRSRKYSTCSVVVVRFSRARGRYERQGVLVEADALSRAEIECLADGPAREQARIRAEGARETREAAYKAEFAKQIAAIYPGCPPDTAVRIADHACQKYSGRVGRSAAAKALDGAAVDFAVRAFIRHALTDYERLLRCGVGRAEARSAVLPRVNALSAQWRRA